jgi:hypothetical protein
MERARMFLLLATVAAWRQQPEELTVDQAVARALKKTGRSRSLRLKFGNRRSN